MRETLHLAVRLMLFALMAAILLAVVNSVTAEPIAQNDRAKVDAARSEVLGEYEYESVEGDLSDFSRIRGVYRATQSGETMGYVYELQSKGYGGTISISMGVQDGKIKAVAVSTHSETKGLGTTAEVPFLDQFAGLPAASEEASKVDAMAGATVSSDAIKAAVAEACRHAESVLGLTALEEGAE